MYLPYILKMYVFNRCIKRTKKIYNYKVQPPNRKIITIIVIENRNKLLNAFNLSKFSKNV